MSAINLARVNDPSIGYGRLGVKLADELVRRGVDVYRNPSHDGPNAGNACWVSVPSHIDGWHDSQHVSVFTMWETMYLPESFRECLHHVDTLLVPSQQNVELFSQHHDNVKLCTLGVDPTEWHYLPRRTPEVFFDFLIGGSGARKGTDLAYKAFLAAFSGMEDPIPRLIMKNPKGEDFTHDRVMVIRDHVTAAEELDIYADAHCYLQPSRGEGFGLQPLQAMAQGIPTILTDAHGHASFAKLGHPISATASQSAYFIYGEARDWWEPDFDELVEQMRYVYENWGIACEKARKASAAVATNFTWANTTDQFEAALDLTAPFTPGRWIKPDPMRFAVRVLKDISLDVGVNHYDLKLGHTYHLLADVKRVLAEAGYLHSECIDEDCGLTTEQVQRLGGNQDHLYCDHCKQRYGTGKSRADDLFALTDGDPDLTKWHAGV